MQAGRQPLPNAKVTSSGTARPGPAHNGAWRGTQAQASTPAGSAKQPRQPNNMHGPSAFTAGGQPPLPTRLQVHHDFGAAQLGGAEHAVHKHDGHLRASGWGIATFHITVALDAGSLGCPWKRGTCGQERWRCAIDGIPTPERGLEASDGKHTHNGHMQADDRG